jgi:hypothetical protein
MPWTVQYDPENTLVVVNGSGEIRDGDASAQTAEAIYFLNQNQSNGVLVDFSDALSEVSLPRLYRLPDYFSELGAPWNVRIAVLLPRTAYRLETYQFFELVCKNAGYNVRLFEAKEAAEQWFAQTSPIREYPSGYPPGTLRIPSRCPPDAQGSNTGAPP